MREAFIGILLVLALFVFGCTSQTTVGGNVSANASAGGSAGGSNGQAAQNNTAPPPPQPPTGTGTNVSSGGSTTGGTSGSTSGAPDFSNKGFDGLLAMGIPLGEMPVWDPHEDELGGNSAEAIARSKVILWKGHCSVHQMFLPAHVEQFRKKYPGIKILVHPECMMEVVSQADAIGSTGHIIRLVEEAPPGTRWAIGTELHLVNRLKHEHPEQEIHFLSPVVCMCATMYRIDLAHLCWAVENLAAGTPVNVIEVDPATAAYALESLQRMLEVK